MSFFAQLKKQPGFGWTLAAIIILMIAYLLHGLLFHYWLEKWEDLPSLPNGETAQEFTDVLVRNRINVVTRQGHYFSCPYQAKENCWIAIPREVNNPQSKDPGKPLPLPPLDTRKMVYTYQGYAEGGTDVLIAVIRANGSVAIWTAVFDGFFEAIHTFLDCTCFGIGIYFLLKWAVIVVNTLISLQKSALNQ